MKNALALALITFLCTSVSAQIMDSKLNTETTNIAFIKGKTGFIIDSIAISTSLDAVPYGFPFPGDTLYLDIEIFLPVDELTIETFAGGRSFGQRKCWVDQPFANVHLSINSGMGQVDSVSQSPINNWFRNMTLVFAQPMNVETTKSVLLSAIYECGDQLIAYPFIEAMLRLPNFRRTDASKLREHFLSDMKRTLRHSYLVSPYRKVTVLLREIPEKHWRQSAILPGGKSKVLDLPTAGLSVLNVYRSADSLSQRDHQILQQPGLRDSLLQSVPIFSLSNEKSQALWRLYQKDHDFDWPHLWQSPVENRLAAYYAIFSGPAYLLISQGKTVEGIYPDLEGVASAIRYRQRDQ